MPTIGEFFNNPKNGYLVARFQALCEEQAAKFAAGLDLHTAVDSSWNWAVSRGLPQQIGVDNVQRIMSQAFKQYNDGRK
jgi:hypothetical protein